MSRYENTVARGNSRNVYGNVINTYNYGPQQTPANLESTPDATGLVIDDIKSIMRRLEFDQMDDRLATIVTAHTDTCEWLFQSEAYTAWRHPDAVNTDCGFLWLKGKPGAGKSTLMKSAKLYGEREHNDTVVCFFFNARGVELQKSTQGMYRSLLYQLLDKRAEQLAALSQREGCSHHYNLLGSLIAKSPQKGSRSAAQDWPIEKMKDMLLDLVLAFSPARVNAYVDTLDVSADAEARGTYRDSVLVLAQANITCYVDALDECNNDDARDIIDFLGALRATAAQASVGFRVLLTSRHYPHITFDACQEITLDSQMGHEDDIAEYIHSKLRIGEGKLASEIRSIVQARASGIFLWVVLVIRILNELYDRGRKHQLRQRLDAIPSGLNNLLEEIVRKDASEGDEMLLAFQWILFARRPLSLKEFYHAMTATFETGDDAISVDDMEKFLLDTSKGLAELTWGENPTVQFIHESVKDYLLDTGLVEIDPSLGTNLVGQCHVRLHQHCRRYLESARTTLLPLFAKADHLKSTYLSIHNEDSGRAVAQRHAEELKKTPFRSKSQQLSDSLTAAHVAHDIVEQVHAACPFLHYALTGIVSHADSANSPGSPQHELVERFPLRLWQEIYTLTNPFHPLSTETSSLYIFVLMGACNLTESCIDTYMTSREWRKDVLPDKHRSLLGVAVHNNDNRMVGVLLSRGMGANWPAKDGDTCLTLALREKHGSLLHQLIDAGATVDPDVNDPWGSPRSGESLRASYRGRVLRVLASSVYKTRWHQDFNGLLQMDRRNEGDPATSDEELRGVLIARLKSLASDNKVEPHQGHALNAACRLEEPEVAAALVQDGVDFDGVRDSWGNTALSLAARMGYDRLALVLLAHRARCDVTNRFGDQPVHQAASNGHDQIVRLLIEAGADPCAPDGYQRRPLHLAAISGHEQVARVLIDHGFATLDALDSLGCTALDAAAAYGNLNIVDMLLEADVPTPAEQLDKAAALASQTGHQHVVERLLEKGARKPVDHSQPRTASGSVVPGHE
jgi:ankyrin repeat protein